MKIQLKVVVTTLAATLALSATGAVSAFAATTGSVTHTVTGHYGPGHAPRLGAKPVNPSHMFSFRFVRFIPTEKKPLNGAGIRLDNDGKLGFYALGKYRGGKFQWDVETAPQHGTVACWVYPSGKPWIGAPGAGSGAHTATCDVWIVQRTGGLALGFRAQGSKVIGHAGLALEPYDHIDNTAIAWKSAS